MRLVLKGHPGDWRNDTDESRGIPPPPASKAQHPDARRIELVPPNDIRLGNTGLREIVARRHSQRDYSGDLLTRAELSFLLWATQGIRATVQDETTGAVCALKTVPSAGARHPFETYVIAHRISGAAPGIYRFLSAEHQLELLCESPSLGWALETACYGQPHVRRAAAVFAWTAIPYRMEWRYGYIAHRMIAIEAGHVCQNLLLAAEAIGAGACAICGYDQRLMDQLIGADGAEEFVVYLATVGKIDCGQP